MRSGKVFPARSESLLLFCAPYCKIAPADEHIDRQTIRVAFQGEPGAFSEAAAIQLLGGAIPPCPARRLRPPSRPLPKAPPTPFWLRGKLLAGSVVRVYDLLLESNLALSRKQFCPSNITSSAARELPSTTFVPSLRIPWLSPSAKNSSRHEHLKRVPAEDTAGSVRDVISRGDKSAAGIAGRQAAVYYGG